MRTAALALAAAMLAAGIARPAFGADPPRPPAPPQAVTFDVAATDARGRAVTNLTPADFQVLVDGAPQAVDAVTSPGAAPHPRAFAIFLDEYHTSASDAERLRPALARFVDEVLTADDQVIVLKPLDSLLAIPLAKDLGEVRSAVESFSGRAGDYEPRGDFEREFMGRAPDAIERFRRQVTVSALNALAVRLGRLGDGRKTILFVSQGFVDARPVRGEEMLPTTGSLVKVANRAGVSIYTLDPSTGTAGSELLRSIASGTEGRALDGADLDSALRRLGTDSTTYYLLTCHPPVPADGRFHTVQIRVKRPNVRVRTRKGFWAAEPDVAASASSFELRELPFARVPRHASAMIRPWFGMSRAHDGKTRVTFVWEPSGRVPGDRSRALPVQVSMTATAPDGSTVYEGTVRPTGATGETQDAAAKAIFDAAPGRLLVRMSITGPNAKELDLDTRDLAIRDLREPVAIGTPEILRARSAREFRMLAADRDAAPVVSREFSRSERLLVRFAAYAPDGDPPRVSARLVSRAGTTMRTLQPQPIDGRPTMSQLDVPLAGFAPGEYTIEVSALARGGSAKEVVTFRVTG